MPLNITITDAGRAEIINAENTGTDPVLITEIGLGTGEYVPDPTQTALVSETKRLNTFSGEVVADDTIHVFIKDESSDAYNVTEFGLFSDSGTLIAVYSQVGDIMQKTAQTSLLLAVDIILATINAASLTFGDISFTNPPATPAVLGVVELATQPEMDAEADATRVPPVKVVADYVGNAASNATAYTDSGAANAYVLTPAGSRKGPRAYRDGAVYEFIAANANTSASTANVAGLGEKNINLKGGANPAAGEIRGRTRLRYDAANDWLELDRSGRVKKSVLTVSDAAWTPQPDTKTIRFTAIGAGGGGGGVDGQGSGTAATSQAGSGGGSAIKTVCDIQPSYAITIGAGGARGPEGNNAGSPGGNTTITATGISLIAYGGSGGEGMLATSGSNRSSSRLPGGYASGGDINLQGGGVGHTSVVSGQIAGHMSSGSSMLGGSRESSIAINGSHASTPGAGGGGTGVFALATNLAGGDGADGVVIIEEFF